MEYKSQQIMKLFIEEKISIRFAHPPQHDSIDFTHLDNNNAQAMYPIFGNSLPNQTYSKRP